MPKHDLVEVHRERSRDGMVDLVTRWCRNCGAIVQDGESDGRVRPGYFMPMQRPRMTKEQACE